MVFLVIILVPLCFLGFAVVVLVLVFVVLVLIFSVFCSWNFFFHFNNPITCAFAHIIFSSSSLSQARVRARAPNTTVSASTLSPP